MTAAPGLASSAVSKPSQGGPNLQIPAELRGPHGLDHPRRAIAIGVVLSAMAMVVIDGAMSNIALPTLAASLGVTSSDAILVMTAYQAAVVMALLPSAALGERFGYHKVFASGVGVFVAASLASAAAPSLPWLTSARFVQGLGGAAILALGVALLRFSVSDARLGAAIGWNALTVALSAAIGPAIGALIVSVADWHWLYAVNIPLGVGVLAAVRALPIVPPQEVRLDAISMVLNFVMFGSAVVAVDTVATTPLLAAGLFLVAALALVMLVKREWPKSRPLVPIDLLRKCTFAVSIVASILCFAGQTAGLIALPFYLQHDLDLSPAQAGLYMTAWPLGVAATAMFTNRVLRRLPASWVCAIGASLLTAGLAAMASWPLRHDPWLVAPMGVICGVGFGLFQVANNRNMFLAAPPARSAAAGGMQGTARLTGQTTGALLVAQLFALPPANAPQLALATGASLTFIAGLVSVARGRRP